MKCRHCAAPLEQVFLDLGSAPPSNAYLSESGLHGPEVHYPLRLMVCGQCWLVQTEDFAAPGQLFDAEYAYFSSTSSTWLAHARTYCEMIRERLSLGKHSQVIEVASNDGYLLRNFVAMGIPCLGIEPTACTAAAAEAQGIPVVREFFGRTLGKTLAATGKSADLVIGNNVYAHVPDINDFTLGLKQVLKPGGVVTLEFPHLLQLIEGNQFDTVYHEHFSYLSLGTVARIFRSGGLRIWDVEELPTHGGSLRVYGCHAADPRRDGDAIARVLEREARAGLMEGRGYQDFQVNANRVKDDLLAFLIEQKRSGKRVAGYGAAAKGSTLLNYAGVRPDLLSFVCDAAPSKQGKFLPGSRIPILPPEALNQERPDWVLILPWNLRDEVMDELAGIRRWGGRFVVAVPETQVFQ